MCGYFVCVFLFFVLEKKMWKGTIFSFSFSFSFSLILFTPLVTNKTQRKVRIKVGKERHLRGRLVLDEHDELLVGLLHLSPVLHQVRKELHAHKGVTVFAQYMEERVARARLPDLSNDVIDLF